MSSPQPSEPTEQLFLDDAYMTEFEATVTAVEGDQVALDRTAFYATSGGQQNDTGTLAGLTVVNVSRRDGVVWHTIEGDPPAIGTPVTGRVDWDRRHANMRTHTAMHILCGVIWNLYGVAVTGGNMEPLSGRMDFDFDPLPPGFKETVEAAINEEIAKDRPISVSYVSREEAAADDSLIRTKVSLVPDIDRIRVIDIAGLDRQADGGTHVHSTREVGSVQIVKVENKGKANKRVRLTVGD
jgi:misacylated tRNA(Ala) deacylase